MLFRSHARFTLTNGSRKTTELGGNVERVRQSEQSRCEALRHKCRADFWSEFIVRNGISQNVPETLMTAPRGKLAHNGTNSTRGKASVAVFVSSGRH